MGMWNFVLNLLLICVCLPSRLAWQSGQPTEITSAPTDAASASIFLVNSSTTSVLVSAKAAPQQNVFIFQSTPTPPSASMSDSICVGFSNCPLPVTLGGLVIRQP